MKIIRQPTIYLLGAQQVLEGELENFLKAHGFYWRSDSDEPAEILTETAGRLCYMSFAKPRPGGNAAYMQHIKEVGHGCYDAETDVLTLSGWKPWPDVVATDKLATMDPATGNVVYRNPIRLIRYEHKGKMYRVDSQHVDLLVTPHHKMYVCKTTTAEGRKKNCYSLRTAMSLGHVSHAYMKNCNGSVDGWWRDSPTRDEMALLGFAIGDGSMSTSPYTVQFHLRRERKIAWLTSLIERLKPLGYSIQIGGDDRYTVRIAERNLIRHLFTGIYDENREKQIPWSDSVFTGATREALEGLYDGLIQSDGSVSDTAIVYDTTSARFAGQFQQLCLHVGLSANVAYTYDKEKRKSSFGNKPLTRLHVNRRCNRPEVNKWSGCDGKTYWVDDWEGEVFCAEVENNLLYVRRNGKPVWSGNSVLEHAVWSILITGVSRSLTHELVRHRAGMGYSQLSQRYVDESVAEYVEPDVIANDPELHAIWVESIARSHEAYVKLAERLTQKLLENSHLKGCPKCGRPVVYDTLGGWVCSNRHVTACDFEKPAILPTDRRKAARQAARSALPNATETKIFVTANARALRHFLEQRCSRHAEPEVRKLAYEIWLVLKNEAPNLFGDYTPTQLPDGSFELNTPYRKV